MARIYRIEECCNLPISLGIRGRAYAILYIQSINVCN